MIRGLASGHPRFDNNWNIIRCIFQKILKGANVPVKEVISAPKPALGKYHFFGIFKNRIHHALTSPSLSAKSAFLQNARAYTFQFNLKSFPTFKFVISRLFQLGFIGVVCTHQHLHHDGYGFMAARNVREDITSLIELFRTKQETCKEEDNESDIIILDESDFDYSCDGDRNTEGMKETALPNLDDMKEFAEMNLLLQDKLKQLEPLIEQLVDEKIQQGKKLSESLEREEYFKRKSEQLMKENQELLRREKLMLEQVKKMMNEMVENHAQIVKENSKCFDKLLADNGCDGAVLKTFVEREDGEGWIILN